MALSEHEIMLASRNTTTNDNCCFTPNVAFKVIITTFVPQKYSFITNFLQRSMRHLEKLRLNIWMKFGIIFVHFNFISSRYVEEIIFYPNFKSTTIIRVVDSISLSQTLENIYTNFMFIFYDRVFQSQHTNFYTTMLKFTVCDK